MFSSEEYGLIVLGKFPSTTKVSKKATVLNDELHKMKIKYPHIEFTFEKRLNLNCHVLFDELLIDYKDHTYFVLLANFWGDALSRGGGAH